MTERRKRLDDTYEFDLVNVTPGRPIFNADLTLNNKLRGLVIVPPKSPRRSPPSFSFVLGFLQGRLEQKKKLSR